jgi:hypothetical protein
MSYEKNMFFENDNEDFVSSKFKNLQEVKKSDKRYDKFVKDLKMKWQDGKYYDKVTVEMFGSGNTGTKIRNAVTGAKTPYLVGSLNEELFFKVMDASGNGGRKDSLMLFYDSPEQYENHQFIILDEIIKESWTNKNLVARKRLDTGKLKQ